MKLTRQDYLAYCEGSLSEKRRIAIEQYLQVNPLERRALEGATSFEDPGKFESILADLDRKIDSKSSNESLENKSKSTRIISLRSLSTLTAIAAIGLILFFLLPAQNSSYSFDQYFDQYPDVLSNIVRGNIELSNNQIIKDGMQAYNEGRYETASTLLSSVPRNMQQYETALFYKAIADLANQQPEKSLATFNRLSENKSFPYADGVLWYSALSYLELGNREKAIQLFENISESDHYKKEEAKTLLLSL